MTTHVQPTSEPALDELDQQLLNRMQFEFPLARSPWEAIAEGAAMTGAQVLDRVKRLKETGIIRQVSAIFDTKALGYTSTLVAARLPAERLDGAASVVSRHPGVSHNYRREAWFNLWFTLAVPPGESLDVHLVRMSDQAGFEDYLPLPTIRTFKIGVKLQLGDEPQAPRHTPRGNQAHPSVFVALTGTDIAYVRALQEDLPLIEQPFDPLCERLGVGFDELRRWMMVMQEAGVLRRFAVILRHRQAGFLANGMVVWRVPVERVEAAGRLAAQVPEVSHCYQRPCSERWPYNLYTMIHARSEPECERVIDRLAEAMNPLGIIYHRTLYSTTEYKKQRVKYFVS